MYEYNTLYNHINFHSSFSPFSSFPRFLFSSYSILLCLLFLFSSFSFNFCDFLKICSMQQIIGGWQGLPQRFSLCDRYFHFPLLLPLSHPLLLPPLSLSLLILFFYLSHLSIAVFDSMKQLVCDVCLTSSDSPLKLNCDKCKLVWYCSPKCKMNAKTYHIFFNFFF